MPPSMANSANPQPEPENWDPPEAQRRWYRSAQTGDLGYIVMRDGKQKIRLNRPMQEIIRSFDEHDWIEERDFRPFSQNQLDRLCFEADKQLCTMLGLHKEARRDWLSLRDADRIDWMKNGPGPGSLRSDLYVAIKSVIGKYSR